jgi:hypothetical protein
LTKTGEAQKHLSLLGEKNVNRNDLIAVKYVREIILKRHFWNCLIWLRIELFHDYQP